MHASEASILTIDIIKTGANKENVGSLKVILNKDQSAATGLTLELKTSFVLEHADMTDFCMLLITQYGDMRSFISETSQDLLMSYGTTEHLVMPFNCIDM